MKKLIMLLLVVLFLLAACLPEEVSSFSISEITKQTKSPSVTMLFASRYDDFSSTIIVYRFTDTEKNVTCWIASGAGAEGISCLPIK